MEGRPYDLGVRPLTSRGSATRDRIVASASVLMHERGVAGTSLDDVRAATQTSKSQLYHYFADKSSLVRAVVDAQVAHVLAAQFPPEDPLDSSAALRRWRDRVVASNERAGFVGGCPLGRLSSELADHDPSARTALDAGFCAWQSHLADGLRCLQQRGELPPDADVERLALGLLATVQGGLLLAQSSRSAAPLAAALDVALDALNPEVARPGRRRR